MFATDVPALFSAGVSRNKSYAALRGLSDWAGFPVQLCLALGAVGTSALGLAWRSAPATARLRPLVSPGKRSAGSARDHCPERASTLGGAEEAWSRERTRGLCSAPIMCFRSRC
ncbi:Hypothetical predicted protein [Marmota monax]|uniref:Uncharacterized protein n=1 Tax=Marmota monax TaxID=9995 RepID=A0A5E4AX47_MARMO|nr:Hypothetical predicted protein [Marmota monax]